MLSRSSESLDEEGGTYLHQVTEGATPPEGGSVQDDVERLIEIAARLFSAIERQIHMIEEELVIACGEQARPYAQTVFKERLISCAKSLESSLKEIAVNLETRANHRTSFGRDNWYT
jgi:hypothetical protein